MTIFEKNENKNQETGTMNQPDKANLDHAVKTVRQKIVSIQEKEEKIGEQNTKTVLINPILLALGWDLNNIDEIYQEYRHRPNDNPVDYALLINRNPCLLIEAKSLEKEVSDHKWINQTLSYATIVGVEWCVLTNGDKYRLYNAHAVVPADQKLFRQIQISDPTQHDFTLDTLDLLSKNNLMEKKINVYWKIHRVDKRVKKIFNLILSINDDLIQLIQKKSEELKPSENLEPIDIQQSLRRADITIKYPEILSSTQVLPKNSSTEKEKITNQGQDKKLPPKAVKEIIGIINARLVTPPLELKTEYKKTELTATLQSNGTILFAGESYASLSKAAGYAKNTVIGLPKDGCLYHSANGWTFWKYYDKKTGQWELIEKLHTQYKKVLVFI